MKLSTFCAIAAELVPAALAAPFVDPIMLGLSYDKPAGTDNRKFVSGDNKKSALGPAHVVGVFEFDPNAGEIYGKENGKAFEWSRDTTQYPLKKCTAWLSSDPGVINPFYRMKDGTVFLTAETAGGFQPDPNSIHVECQE